MTRFDISNMNNKLEIDNSKLNEVINKMSYELNSYKEANKRYENVLKNNKDNNNKDNVDNNNSDGE